ncbi:hypothetical protein Tco_1206258 [Tanacetum coccineum]
MKDNPQLQQDDLPIWLALKYKFERQQMSNISCRPCAVRPRNQDDPHDDAHSEGENSAKRQKTFEHGIFVFGESSSGQDNEDEPGPSTSGNQEQLDDFDFWTYSYAIDDDELPTEKVSQELMDEVSQTVDEAKLRKVVDEMLRQKCTSGDDHQYHIDHMQNFLKNDIVWESRKEILVPPYQPKPSPVVQRCQRNPKAPALSLVNQDLLYLNKGNSGPEKIALSLHKFPPVRFPDNDIEERTSRWVTKCVKKFNPYALYGVEHWKNQHVKIYYIKRQQEPEKPKPDYKNLNKNDIEDMYLLIVNHKVDDYVETGLLWSLSVFIRSTVIWERVHDFQLGLKSYKNDVKYGYVTLNLSKEDVEYLHLFKEEIEERLKHHDRMRCWEMLIAKNWRTMHVLFVVKPRLKTNQLCWTAAFEDVKDVASPNSVNLYGYQTHIEKLHLKRK